MGNQDYGCKMCKQQGSEIFAAEKKTEIYESMKDSEIKEKEVGDQTIENISAEKIQRTFRLKRNNKKQLIENKLCEIIQENCEKKGIKVNKCNIDEFEEKIKELTYINPIREKFRKQLEQIKYEGKQTIYDLPCLSFFDENNETTEYDLGQWNNKGEICGKVQTLAPDNSYFEGIIQDNLFEGKGLFIKNDGSYYFGDWKNGKCEGDGILKIKNISIYKGKFKNNIKNGNGKEYYPDSSIYEKEFVDEEEEGRGNSATSDESYYEGNFRNSMYDGKGYIKWRDGRNYKGDFKNGFMDGNGIYRWPNGSYYEGNFSNNKKCGEGTFYSPNEYNLSCNWVNNIPHGEGTLKVEKNGTTYTYGLRYRNGKIISRKQW